MRPPEVKVCYDENDLNILGFHDCYIYGVRWDRDAFGPLFDLDYIVQWVDPAADGHSYWFWICRAELCFRDISDAVIELTWHGLAPECQIREVRRKEARKTANGNTQWLWEIDLTLPEGAISLWATGFELRITSPPRLSDRQRLQRGDSRSN